jgi:hypothetical protein
MEPKTSVIAELWKREQCPVEYGIFFPDDTVIPFAGLRPSGARGQIDWSKSAGCACLDPVQLFGDGMRIFGGETSWEGAGFLAVCDAAGNLQWLLHCEVSEPFRSATVIDGAVAAVSEEYPQRLEWQLPIASPCKCRVTAAP